MFNRKSKQNIQLDITRSALEKEIEFLKQYIEDIKKEKEDLRNQIIKLTEALVAKESPSAYNYQKAEELEKNKSPEQKEEERRSKENARLMVEFTSAMEDPLFMDVDDMKSKLLRIKGPPMSEPIHPGWES